MKIPLSLHKLYIMANKVKKKKIIYRTVFHFEVLSETPIGSMSLEDLAEETSTGDMSGRFLTNSPDNQELTGTEAVEAIKEQGTDLEFFMLNELGNEIYK